MVDAPDLLRVGISMYPRLPLKTSQPGSLDSALPSGRTSSSTPRYLGSASRSEGWQAQSEQPAVSKP